MQQYLVPLLLLATVAFSSSNILPILSINQLDVKPFGLNAQENDNIFSNKLHTRNILNHILCEESIGTQNKRLPKLCKILRLKYIDTDNNRADENFNNVVNKEDNYNGEGFRKEQWHNYPRQLDRLHNYLYEHFITDNKRNLDIDNLENTRYYNVENAPEIKERNVNEVTANEFLLDSNDGPHKVHDTVVAASNPLLILKIRLACLKDDIRNIGLTKYSDLVISQPKSKIDPEEEEKLFMNEINPAIDIMKVKREDTPNLTDIEFSENATIEKKKAVKKRLFSLWSRLQGLSHKGHDLQHRRHLNAFYGISDADGNGALTAETRATIVRPLGSPLRWG